jgi:hypothetical protein
LDIRERNIPRFQALEMAWFISRDKRLSPKAKNIGLPRDTVKTDRERRKRELN